MNRNFNSDAFFSGRLAIQQRVSPSYRAAFFKLLSSGCRDGLSIFAGDPLPVEQIKTCERIEGVHVYSAKNRHLFRVSSPFYRCWQSGIIDWLEAWNPDALIVEANPRYPSTSKAIVWMRAQQRPVLGWGLGVSPLTGIFSGMRNAARRKLLDTLDGVIAYSQRGAHEYIEFGVPEKRVFVAKNAVVSRPDLPMLNRPVNFDGQSKVLFVGRLQARKRLDLLFQACASLPENLRPLLWIVGDGPGRQDFQAAAEATYPASIFWGGLYGKDLEDLFLKADLFVLPGTGGLAIQQAMSFGLPVIAAQGDGTQDDLISPENGWNIVPNSLSALNAALAEALSDPLRLRNMGAVSYRIVSEQVNLECMRDAFIAALNSMPSPQS